MTLNLRPKGDPTAPAYAPHRDLANIFAPMMQEVFLAFAEANWPEHYKGWIEGAALTEKDFVDAAEKFGEGVKLFIREPDVKSPHDAFERSGFLAVPAPARVLLFARIGEVATGGFFVAFRDVTLQGFKSSVHDDFVAMLAAGKALAARLREIEDLAADPEERSVVERFRDKLKPQTEIYELERTLNQANRERDLAMRRAAEAGEMANEMIRNARQSADDALQLHQLRALPWRRRLGVAFRYLFYGSL